MRWREVAVLRLPKPADSFLAVLLFLAWATVGLVICLVLYIGLAVIFWGSGIVHLWRGDWGWFDRDDNLAWPLRSEKR
jgi:hypothetical protein